MNILRLRDVLTEKGVTGKYLAQQTGVTPATISNIINGNHFPKGELLAKIAEALNVEVRYLFKTKKKLSGEPIYIKKNDNFIRIGELDLKQFKDISKTNSDK